MDLTRQALQTVFKFLNYFYNQLQIFKIIVALVYASEVGVARIQVFFSLKKIEIEF